MNGANTSLLYDNKYKYTEWEKYAEQFELCNVDTVDMKAQFPEKEPRYYNPAIDMDTDTDGEEDETHKTGGLYWDEI